ncbi:hypothetical protein EV126DRAFT_213432 [Verticillium dahliae]|nr:hypothetical protein EV126DRAFT_213432 [Verticillium dahliae]
MGWEPTCIVRLVPAAWASQITIVGLRAGAGVDKLAVSSLSFGHAPTYLPTLPHLSCLTLLGTRDRHPPAKVPRLPMPGIYEGGGRRSTLEYGSIAAAHRQVPCVLPAAWPMWFEELCTMRCAGRSPPTPSPIDARSSIDPYLPIQPHRTPLALAAFSGLAALKGAPDVPVFSCPPSLQPPCRCRTLRRCLRKRDGDTCNTQQLPSPFHLPFYVALPPSPAPHPACPSPHALGQLLGMDPNVLHHSTKLHALCSACLACPTAWAATA